MSNMSAESSSSNCLRKTKKDEADSSEQLIEREKNGLKERELIDPGNANKSFFFASEINSSEN